MANPRVDVEGTRYEGTIRKIKNKTPSRTEGGEGVGRLKAAQDSIDLECEALRFQTGDLSEVLIAAGMDNVT